MNKKIIELSAEEIDELKDLFNDDTYYFVIQAQNALLSKGVHIPDQTLRYHSFTGQLKAYKDKGRLVFKGSDLKDYLESRKPQYKSIEDRVKIEIPELTVSA